MQAGRLRHRITIQRAPKPWTQDAAGQGTPTWAEFCRPWARRVFPSGSERFVTQQPVALATPLYEVRSDSKTRQVTADESFRLVDGDRSYDIEDVFPNERGDMLTIRVKGRAEVAA